MNPTHDPQPTMRLTGHDAEMGLAARLLQDLCTAANATWWRHPGTGEELDRDALIPSKLMLAVSELAEAMEGFRKQIPDDKLPHRPMYEVELADALIRIFDLAGQTCDDLPGAFVEKMRYNAIRADHKPEARVAAGGKRV